MEGKGSLHGGRYFMDEDIVLVTLNYRVGALGKTEINSERMPAHTHTSYN